MRMWMVTPQQMCRRHLLGEHVELHMLAGSLVRGKRLDGFVRKGLVEPQAIGERHSALVAEMLRRGYNHQSPLNGVLVREALACYPQHIREARVNVAHAQQDLEARCPDCAARATGSSAPEA